MNFTQLFPLRVPFFFNASGCIPMTGEKNYLNYWDVCCLWAKRENQGHCHYSAFSNSNRITEKQSLLLISLFNIRIKRKLSATIKFSKGRKAQYFNLMSFLTMFSHGSIEFLIDDQA